MIIQIQAPDDPVAKMMFAIGWLTVLLGVFAVLWADGAFCEDSSSARTLLKGTGA